MGATVLDALRYTADVIRSTLPLAVGKRVTNTTLRTETYAADIADGSTYSSKVDISLTTVPPVKKLSAEKASFFGANPAQIADGKAVLATYRIGPITPSYIVVTAPVTQTGTGTGVVDVINALSSYGPGAFPSCIVRIMAGGPVGTATFQLSTNGGATYTGTLATAAAVSAGPFQITFSGSFTITDQYAFGIMWGGWDIPAWLQANVDTRHRHLVIVSGPDTGGSDDICKVIECDAVTREISTFLTVQSTAISP